MNTSNAKIGQRVVLQHPIFMRAVVGATATVVGIRHVEQWLELKWDRNVLTGTQSDGLYEASRFDIAEPQKEEFILIVRDEDGDLKPANRPTVYTSEAQALAVAEKMASQYGGEFIVFKAFASTTMPKPVPVKPTTRRFA